MRTLKFLILSILLLTAASCRPRPSQSDGNYNFHDRLGRQIELQGKPRRIISFAPNITEMIYALRAEDRLVGVTSWCSYPPEAKSKTVVGDYASPNWERILALRPDLVLLVGTRDSPILSRLEAHRIPAAAFCSETPQDIMAEISLLGVLLDREPEADSLTRSLAAQLDSLRPARDLAPAPRPAVFAEISDRPLLTGNDRSFLGQLIALAGGKNIAADMPETYAAFNPELVIARKPDIILIFHPGTDAREVARRPGWAHIPAVKNGRIYYGFDLELMMRPGPRFVQAARMLQQIFYEKK